MAKLCIVQLMTLHSLPSLFVSASINRHESGNKRDKIMQLAKLLPDLHEVVFVRKKSGKTGKLKNS